MRVLNACIGVLIGGSLVLGCVEEDQVPARTQPASTVVVSHPGTTNAQPPASPPVVNNIVQPAPTPAPNVTIAQPAPAATTTTTTTTAPAGH